MEPSLSVRQRRIIAYLSAAGNWMTGQELADLLGVSDRTIRSDIEQIKQQIPQEIIFSSKQSGYKLNQDYQLQPEVINRIYLPKERVTYLACQLLTKQEGIDLEDQANELYVSDATINSDLQQLKKIIYYERLALTIEKVEVQVTLTGDLIDKNQLLWYLFNDYLALEDVQETSKYLNDIPVKDLIDDVMLILVSEKYFSRYLSMRNLMYTVLFIAQSMINGFDDRQVNEKVISNDSSLVTKIIACLERNLNLFVPEGLFMLINDCVNRVNEMAQYEQQQLEAQPWMALIVNRILHEIKDLYHFDFELKQHLVEDLTQHIHFALERQKRYIRIENPLKEKMQQEYPFLYDVGFYFGKRIYDYTNVQYNSDEISYLVCHLADAYEEIQNTGEYKTQLNILLIALEGKAVCKFIARFISQLKFSEMLNVVEVVSIAELEYLKAQNKEFDIIIATSLIETNLYQPDLYIRSNLGKTDEFSIKTLINRELTHIKTKQFNAVFHNFFNEQYFFSNTNYQTAEMLINGIGEILIKDGIATMKFIESVLERESLISTELDTGIALPHATEVKTNKSVVSVITLGKGILWYKKKVKVVMLFAIADKDYHNLNDFYNFIASFANDERNIQKLNECRKYEEFYQLMHDVYVNE